MALFTVKKRTDFLRAKDHGTSVATKAIVLQAVPNEHTKEGRIGLTVTKKHGNAVARNRMKRRLRAALDDVMPQLAKPGHDYICIARHSLKDRPFDALVKDLRYAFHTVHK